MNFRSKATFITAFMAVTIIFGLQFLFMAPTVSAQTELNRISAVERSDGNGFVVRHHLTQAVDSFSVFQPRKDLIQMVLYAQDLDTLNFRHPEPHSAFKEFNLFNITTGFAVDIHLEENARFTTSAYPDQNGRDLLLALTTTTAENLAEITEDMEPIDWRPHTEQQAGQGDLFGDEAERVGSTFDVVVLDAGHGGKDPGSIGVGGIREKDIALAVTMKVGEYIKQNIPDLKVVYTRTDDSFVELAERGRIANQHSGDLFVSIHANSFSHQNIARQQQANGAEVYILGMARSQAAIDVMKRENAALMYENGDTEQLTEEELLIYELTNAGNMSTSERIAEKVENQFRERAQRRSRGVKQAGFQVLYEASMPGVLIELGFLSNPNEARYLNTEYGQAIVASAIFRSIRDFKIDYDRMNNRQTSTR